MEKKFGELRTFRSEIEINVIIRNEEEKTLTAKLLTEVDKTEIENQRVKGNFDFKFLQRGEEFLFDGENILVGENYFIKFNQFPSLSFLTDIGFYPNAIKNRWIKLDFESLKELLVDLESEFEVPDLVENFERSKLIQKDIEEKLRNLLVGEKLYLIKKELPDEKIDKKNAYHYIFALNRKEIKKLLPEIMEIYFQGIFRLLPEKFQPLPEEKENFVTDLTEKIANILDKVGEIEGEIWIGKKDLLIYKMEVKKSIKLADLTNGKESGNLNFKLDINFSNYDQEINIVEPAEFLAIKKVFEEIFGPVIKMHQIQERDKERKSDMELIKSALDFYYTIYKNYPVSKTMPNEIKIKINEKEECLFSNCERPKDPDFGPCPDYQWISNLKNPQKFCAFACLENGKFFAVSHKGIQELEELPKTLDCW